MLRSYGRLLTSFSCWSTSIRCYASKAVKAKPSKTPKAKATPTATEIGRAKAVPKAVKPRKVDSKPKATKGKTGDAALKPFVGLAERQAALEAKLQEGFKKRRTRRVRVDGKLVDPSVAQETKSTSTAASAKATKSKRTKKADTVPPRLLPLPEQKHHDLASYTAYVECNKINTDSWTHRGTHFEYTVAEALKPYAFTLHRTAGANDLGIDFVGHWTLPQHANPGAEKRKLIMQCKLSKPMPAMIRELEGAYTGAPAGWRGDDVLGLLASLQPSTKGVRAAIQRSRWPLGVLQVTDAGEVKQFLWNAVAAEKGLGGLGVAVRYASKRGGMVTKGSDRKEEDGETVSSIAFTWLGKLWRPREAGESVATLAAT